MSKTTTAGIQSVERRLHTRHRARTTVYITTPTGRKKLCRAINLSATGVFVETTNLGLRKGQQVELALAINLGGVTKLHRRSRGSRVAWRHRPHDGRLHRQVVRKSY